MSAQRTIMCYGDSLTWGWIPVKEECQLTVVHTKTLRHIEAGASTCVLRCPGTERRLPFASR